MPRFLEARFIDAETLTQISISAFNNDVHYGAPGEGGPPGFDSVAWQRKIIKIADYFKILLGDQIVGGIIIFRKRKHEYELGRMFINPENQNMGIGKQAFDFLWETYPSARRWTLATPSWNRRTQHFYRKVGFKRIGSDDDGTVLFEYSPHS